MITQYDQFNSADITVMAREEAFPDHVPFANMRFGVKPGMSEAIKSKLVGPGIYALLRWRIDLYWKVFGPEERAIRGKRRESSLGEALGRHDPSGAPGFILHDCPVGVVGRKRRRHVTSRRGRLEGRRGRWRAIKGHPVSHPRPWLPKHGQSGASGDRELGQVRGSFRHRSCSFLISLCSSVERGSAALKRGSSGRRFPSRRSV